MAKRNSGNQDFTPNADGFDMIAGVAPRKLTLTGGDVIVTGATSGGLTYSFPTVANYTRLIGSNGGNNANFTNDVGTYAVITVSGATTVLLYSSPKNQLFTGATTTACICRLPSATTVEVGTAYEIINESAAVIQLQDGNSGTAFTGSTTGKAIYLYPFTKTIVRCTNIATTAGSWNVQMFSIEGAALGTQCIITPFTGYTLQNTTAVQKIFNSTSTTPATTLNAGVAGSVTLQANTAYRFECMVYLSGLSATSGNFGFTLGNAAAANCNWISTSMKIAAPATAVISSTSPGSAHMTYNITNANTALCLASTATVGYFFVRGSIFCSTAAITLIPQINTSVGVATALVRGGSYFKIEKIGASTSLSTGNWG